MSHLETAAGPQRGLREIVSYSLLSGLCPLIPIPFLDDWARDLLRQRLTTLLATHSSYHLSSDQLKLLACGNLPENAQGCGAGCVRHLIIQPVLFLAQLIFRKLVRKILFFLTIKDTVETFSETFHEAYLLRHAFTLGLLPRTLPPPPGNPRPAALDPRSLAVRRAVEAVYRSADTRPVTSLTRSLFRSSWRGIAATARQMTVVLRRARRDGAQQVTERLRREGEERLGGLITELTEDLEQQGGYLEQLTQRLEERLVTIDSESSSPA
ncbi:MAG: hypothetical protein AAF657_09580 [Acidobacteriota bacterium]